MTISKALSTALIDGTGAITPANVTVSTNNLTVGSSLYVVANGNVGIGTSNSPYKLSLANGIFFAGAVGGEGGELQIANISNTCGLFLDVESSNYIRYLNYTSNTGMYFGNTSNYAQLYVQSNTGNIGINTSAPASQLDIWANVNSGYQSPITFSALNSNSVKRSYAQIQYSIEQNAAGSESGGIQFKVLRSNTMVTAAALNGAAGAQYWSFATENQERMRITSDGHLQIGNYADGGNTLRYLDIQNSNTGSSAGAIIRLITANSSGGAATTVDMVKYKNGSFYINNNDGSGLIGLGTAGSERMRIDSAGTVSTTGALIVGNTAYSTATNSISLNNGRIMLTKNDDWGIEMAGSIGTRIRFYANNGGQTTTVGSIQVDNATARYYAGSMNLNYQGINFPSTQNASSDANTLDDYEEGSWTPVFTADTPPTSVTYSSRSGTYTKIGDVVYIRCTVILSSKGTGGSGTVYITGLPFSAAGLSGGYAYQNLGGLCYPSSGDTFTAIYGAVYDNGSAIVTHSAPGATSTMQWSQYGNASKISFSGSYKIN